MPIIFIFIYLHSIIDLLTHKLKFMETEFKFNVRVYQDNCSLSYDFFSLVTALSVFSDWFGNCNMVTVLDLSNYKVVAKYAKE